MAPLRTLLPLLLATSALADFHIETRQMPIDVNGNVPVLVTVVNATPITAKSVTFGTNAGSMAAIEAPGWSCAVGTGCKFGRDLAPGESATLTLRSHFDAPYGRQHTEAYVSADLAGQFAGAHASADAVLYRRFAVTQTGDSGAGSLRAAVEALDADAACATVPCAIDVDVSGTIVLRSALPRIQGRDVRVSGAAVLDGAAVAGNALDFDPVERAEVDGLTIRNFGDNAVLLRLARRVTAFDASRVLAVTNCVIENNLRGVNVTDGYLGGGSLIRDNVLRSNRRSAIFDGSAHDPALPLEPVLRIERNRIAGNGASGIYFGEGSDGALIVDNVIESSHDFGIAVARGAREVRILANSIAHNGGAAVDLGLDGPAPVADRNTAVIDSAVYDAAANTTVVTGRPSVNPISPCDLCETHIVSLYANDSAEHGEYAEAQVYLGEAKPNGSGFVFTYNGDLRGKYLTALPTRWMNLVGSNLYDASEPSKAFLVR